MARWAMSNPAFSPSLLWRDHGATPRQQQLAFEVATATKGRTASNRLAANSEEISETAHAENSVRNSEKGRHAENSVRNSEKGRRRAGRISQADLLVSMLRSEL